MSKFLFGFHKTFEIDTIFQFEKEEQLFEFNLLCNFYDLTNSNYNFVLKKF